jgi:adenosylhomocysteine nucleosidase
MGARHIPYADPARNRSLNVVGIVAALATETRVLGPVIGKRGALASLVDGSLLAVSGIGCAAARLAAQALVDAGATALTSWGLAGGLDPALCAGTIFLPSEVICERGVGFTTARYWRDGLSAAVGAPRSVACGKLLTRAHMIEAIADKAAAFRETGALAVDMESFAVAEIAAVNGLPFIAIRVIVDTAADSVPRALLGANRSGRLRLWRLIAAITLEPTALAALVRLAQRYRAARRSLRAVARAGSLGALAFPHLSDSRIP